MIKKVTHLIHGERGSSPSYSSISSINFLRIKKKKSIEWFDWNPREKVGSFYLRFSTRVFLNWWSEWDLRAWLRRLTLRPLFRGLTFSLKSSHSCPVSCFEAKNSVSGSEISTLVSAIGVLFLFFFFFFFVKTSETIFEISREYSRWLISFFFPLGRASTVFLWCWWYGRAWMGRCCLGPYIFL